MTEKKDPHKKIAADDLFDDEPIIDLTEEVKIEPEEGRKVATSKTGEILSPKADKDPAPRDDEGIITFKDSANLTYQDDPYIVTGGLSAENDNRIGLSGNIVSEPDGDDDLLIMDGGQDVMDGDAAAVIDDDAIEMAGDEIRNNFDEDIELEYEIDEDEIDFFSSDGDRVQEDEITAIPSEASATFGKDDKGRNILSDIDFEHEAGDEILPLADLDDDGAEGVDDIIEINEFDQHYADDDEDDLEQTGPLDPSGLKDEDFLELFDIEEEGPLKDEKLKRLSASEEKAVEAELSRFFDETSEDDVGIENNDLQPTDKFFAMDADSELARAAASLSSVAGEFDRPDTSFPPDPGSEENHPMRKDSPAAKAGGFPGISSEQIDQAIERIVNAKLAGRIEHIIYEIIEKAVKREIDQLKESLLEDSTPDDDI
jgi:hypothetical protein